MNKPEKKKPEYFDFCDKKDRKFAAEIYAIAWEEFNKWHEEIMRAGNTCVYMDKSHNQCQARNIIEKLKGQVEGWIKDFNTLTKERDRYKITIHKLSITIKETTRRLLQEGV